jgi:hypothetical protein
MMSSNSGFIYDEDGDDSDWLEIYNTSDRTISLASYSFSDNSAEPGKWQFPSISLTSKSFLLIFASGKDKRAVFSELHTNFSIKSAGEHLGLYESGQLVMDVPETSLSENESIGLETDGIGDFIKYSNPTPGTTNSDLATSGHITFSVRGGFYAEPFTLEILSEDTSQIIRYTIDGNPPNASSPIYPLSGQKVDHNLMSNSQLSQIQVSMPQGHVPSLMTLPRCIVLRVASFSRSGILTGAIYTQSYFIDTIARPHGVLPVVSICVDTSKLINHDTGLFVPGVHWNAADSTNTGNYYQKGKGWERELNMEYYTRSGSEFINQNCGMRLHGLGSRRPAQKAMRFYARKEYGESRFNISVFEDRPHVSYKRLLLKPMMASWSLNGCTDYVSGQLAKGLKVDYLANKPVVVYINGEYWGVYFLQERLDERYIGQNHPEVEEESVDLIESWYGKTAEGGNENFLKLYDYIENSDLKDAEHYEEVSDWIDIDNFIDYQLIEIFISNYDWPANNMKCWRERKDGAKWRWIYFDGDGALQNINFNGFKFATDTGDLFWPTNARSTLFLRKLLQNEDFHKKFWSRFEELANSNFTFQNTKPIIEMTKAAISGEVLDQINRFGKPTTYSEWEKSIASIDTYLERKPCVLVVHAFNDFGVRLLVDDCFLEVYEGPIINLFPNPNTGTFSYIFPGSAEEEAVVEILNTNGQVVWSREIVIKSGLNKVDILRFTQTKGIYYIRVSSEGDISAKKLIVY